MTEKPDHLAKILASLLIAWAITDDREDIAVVNSFVKVYTFTKSIS